MRKNIALSIVLVVLCVARVSAQNGGNGSYTPAKINERPEGLEYPLDNPPQFHSKLLDFGERPCWSPDGKRIAFVESNFGDVCEIDMDTRKVRNLTKGLGEHHSFLRVHYLPSGDYILIGPAEFKDRIVSRHVESELWFMDKDASEVPKLLGRRIFEGVCVSKTQNLVAYSICGMQDPSIGRIDQFEVYAADIEVDGKNARLVNERVLYKAEIGYEPEPQDLRFGDTELIMAEYYAPKRDVTRMEANFCATKGINMDTGEVKLYIYEPGVHNECEGIFPNDENYICLESSAHNEIGGNNPTDVWRLKLDGSGERVRITRMVERKPWRASNPVVSPDGKWLAYMINLHTSEAGYGMGLGLLDLEAWGKSDYARQTEIPDNMK